MSEHLRTFYCCIAIIACFTFTSTAQPNKGQFIDASIGFGLSYPDEDINIGASGFFIEGEYVYAIKKWFGVRPYLAFVSTKFNEELSDEALKDFDISTSAVMLGTKVRLAIPIPYVAPFIEVGVGGSIGKFVTYTPFTNVEKKGFQFHIPFTLGLAVGRDNGVDLEFAYYYHPSAEQFTGAAAIGLSFPLDE